MAGEIGDAPSSKLEATKVTQIFNTTVYNGSANLVGTATDSMISFNISANDMSALEEILRENGIDDSDLHKLKIALASEPKPTSAKAFGPKVSAWISTMINKAADGTWNVGLGAAGSRSTASDATVRHTLQYFVCVAKSTEPAPMNSKALKAA